MEKNCSHSQRRIRTRSASFIKTHYQVQLDYLASKGLNFSHSLAAINDMIWSTSVQYGPTTGLISRALKGKNLETLTDADVITIVQDYKINHVEDLSIIPDLVG